jgi:hypothetical protein
MENLEYGIEIDTVLLLDRLTVIDETRIPIGFQTFLFARS